jgi:TPR repeat protein
MKFFCILLITFFIGQVSADPFSDAFVASARGDYAAELKIIRPLALKGEAWAQFFLGEKYREGKGVVKNDAEAVKWYRLAGVQGNERAQSNVGAMYGKDRGVLQDYAKAHALSNLAATKGNALAVKNRDIVANLMTLQQIADAQKMAQDCLAQNFNGRD